VGAVPGAPVAGGVTSPSASSVALYGEAKSIMSDPAVQDHLQAVHGVLLCVYLSNQSFCSPEGTACSRCMHLAFPFPVSQPCAIVCSRCMHLALP
jgi:hypothetical protein